jgi:hypothetical protein
MDISNRILQQHILPSITCKPGHSVWWKVYKSWFVTTLYLGHYSLWFVLVETFKIRNLSNKSTHARTHAHTHTHTQEQPRESILLEVSHISRKLQHVSNNVLIYPRQHGTSWESPVMWVRELHCTMLLQSHYCCNQSTTKGGNQCSVHVQQNASAWQSKTLCLCSVRNLLSFGFLIWHWDFWPYILFLFLTWFLFTLITFSV